MLVQLADNGSTSMNEVQAHRMINNLQYLHDNGNGTVTCLTPNAKKVILSGKYAQWANFRQQLNKMPLKYQYSMINPYTARLSNGAEIQMLNDGTVVTNLSGFWQKIGKVAGKILNNPIVQAGLSFVPGGSAISGLIGNVLPGGQPAAPDQGMAPGAPGMAPAMAPAMAPGFSPAMAPAMAPAAPPITIINTPAPAPAQQIRTIVQPEPKPTGIAAFVNSQTILGLGVGLLVSKLIK